MSAWNRAKLLWGYLRRSAALRALPVEYIVERLVKETGPTAEHMMLIGLGEPLLDPKIFDRITYCYCARHGISTLLSTNGTFLDEVAAASSAAHSNTSR